MEFEVITFESPGSASTLYVSGLPVTMEREDKWKALHDAFSKHGLLYEVQLPTNEQLDYGFIRYYSHNSANFALNELHRKLVIGGRLIKVALSSAACKYSKPNKLLHVTKCHQLANYYLGFNGWTIEMKEWNKSVKTDGQVVYSCLAVLRVRGWSVECEGMATVEIADKSNSSLGMRAVIQKQCYQKACESAFSKLVIMVSSSGSLNVHTLEASQNSVITDVP